MFEGVDGLEDGVEDVGFAKAREIETLNCLAAFVLVLRRVNLEPGLHVESVERHPVVGLKIWEKRVGPVFGVVSEPTVGVTAEEHEHDPGDRSFGGREIGYGMRHAIVEDAKVFFFQAGNDIPALRGGNHVEGDDGNITRNGDTGLRRLLRRSRRLSLLRFLLLLRGRRSAALRASGSLSKGGTLNQWQRQSDGENSQQNWGNNGLHLAPLWKSKNSNFLITPPPGQHHTHGTGKTLQLVAT